jgi:hypothetical protein
MISRRVGSEKKGAGRKVAIEHQPLLEDNFLNLLAEFTAGDPKVDGVLWPHLSHREISRRLAEKGTPARPVPAKAWCFIRSPLPNNLWRKRRLVGA